MGRALRRVPDQDPMTPTTIPSTVDIIVRWEQPRLIDDPVMLLFFALVGVLVAVFAVMVCVDIRDEHRRGR